MVVEANSPGFHLAPRGPPMHVERAARGVDVDLLSFLIVFKH